MDNVSHSLAGLVLARAGLNRVTPHATLLLILSANIPDIDIVALAKSQFAYLEMHRGPTHALIAAPLLALECVLLVAGIYRKRLPWAGAWIVCCAGVLSHLLLDLTNTYGIRLLFPFSAEWFHLDLNALTDFPVLALLVLAAIWPALSGLVSGEIGERKKSSGQGIAIAVLILCLGFDVCRYSLRQRAIAQLEARLYSGVAPLETAALPTSVNPFLWRGIVATKTNYLELNVNTLGQVNTESAKSFFRVPSSEAVARARRTMLFSYFLYFARYPVWSVQPVPLNDGTGTRIELTDLRFGEPGAGSFHAIALENPAKQVLGTWFTYGSGAEIGWAAPKK